MSIHKLDPGRPLPPRRPVLVNRYSGAARVNHWITALCLILLALSGLALFHPDLFFLTALFGGGQNTRAIHPWIGVALFFSFFGLFLRFWRGNLWRAEDGTWMRRVADVLANREDRLPEVGHYNAGQKIVFWSMSALIIVLIASGLVIWEAYFSDFTAVETKRFALLIHAGAAVAIICVWIVHAYSALWVRGSIPGMVRGFVTGGWAWKHHRKWLRERVAGKDADRPGAAAAE